jgi:hypothetical protein
MDSMMLPSIPGALYMEIGSCYPALAMSHGHPERKRKSGRTRLISRREECDKRVTVVCSRYEKEGKPVSLIRTCQELALRCPTVEISGVDGVEIISTSECSGMSWTGFLLFVGLVIVVLVTGMRSTCFLDG